MILTQNRVHFGLTHWSNIGISKFKTSPPSPSFGLSSRLPPSLLGFDLPRPRLVPLSPHLFSRATPLVSSLNASSGCASQEVLCVIYCPCCPCASTMLEKWHPPPLRPPPSPCSTSTNCFMDPPPPPCHPRPQDPSPSPSLPSSTRFAPGTLTSSSHPSHGTLSSLLGVPEYLRHLIPPPVATAPSMATEILLLPPTPTRSDLAPIWHPIYRLP